MVHVIFAKVVLWKVCDIRLLNMGNVRWPQQADVHFENCSGMSSKVNFFGQLVSERDLSRRLSVCSTIPSLARGRHGPCRACLLSSTSDLADGGGTSDVVLAGPARSPSLHWTLIVNAIVVVLHRDMLHHYIK